MVHRLLLLLVFFSSIGFAADMSFYKQALVAISNHFKKDLPNLLDDIGQDANNYLQTSSALFAHVKSVDGNQLDNFSDLVAGFPGATITFGGGTTTIVTNGYRSVTTINGRTQKTSVSNIGELNEALREGYWIAIRGCLLNIAVAAEKALINKKDDQSIALAKRWATDKSIPEAFRKKLLGALADTENQETIDWLLRQPDFKDSAKNGLIQKLVTKAIEQNAPDKAENLIKKHLESGYSSQQTASNDLFYYFFNKGELKNAERILVTHFTHGYSSYTSLAQEIFYFHINKGDFASAEACLAKHYSKGYSSSNELVKILVNHLVKNNRFEEARRVTARNMDQGYSAHTEVSSYIDKMELEFLRNQQRMFQAGQGEKKSL